MSPHFTLMDVSKIREEELQDLAFELADSAARSDIECICVPVGRWMDTQNIPQSAHKADNDDNRKFVDRALHYLELRGDATADYRFIRDTEEPHLVRFKETP